MVSQRAKEILILTIYYISAILVIVCLCYLVYWMAINDYYEPEMENLTVKRALIENTGGGINSLADVVASIIILVVFLLIGLFVGRIIQRQNKRWKDEDELQKLQHDNE